MRLSVGFLSVCYIFLSRLFVFNMMEWNVVFGFVVESCVAVVISFLLQSVWQRAAGGVGRECMRTTSDEETFFFRVSELRHLSYCRKSSFQFKVKKHLRSRNDLAKGHVSKETS